MKKKIIYKDHSVIGHCVYLLFNKNKIVYVGYTFNLAKRLGEHSQWLPFYSDGKKYNSTLPDVRGLTRKEFTHYSYISSNNEKRTRELEKRLIKKYNPKYNNHRDYKWEFTEEDYTMYKFWTHFDRKHYGKRSEEVQPITYKKMIWVKKTKDNSYKNIVYYKNKDGNIVEYNKSTKVKTWWETDNK